MGRVLAISSHVARGTVGLGLTVPALQALGHEIWPIPTILLASRPGLGLLAKHDVPPDAIQRMLAALEADGCWPTLDAVLTGYFPSPRSVEIAAEAIARMRAAQPDLNVLVDPILGDGGRLYIAEDTAAAIRKKLLPLATIVTPNLFELSWLTGIAASSAETIAAAARTLGLGMVVVTSASHTDEKVSTLLVTRDEVVEQAFPAHRDIPNGAGDLFAGLLLGHLLHGRAGAPALAATLRDLDPVLAASQGKSVLQLSALRTGTP